MHMQCVFLYVMHGLRLNRHYAAPTSSCRQRIVFACCPQRVDHFVCDMIVVNNLGKVRGPNCPNSSVLGGQSSSPDVSVAPDDVFVCGLPVRCGQRTDSWLPLCTRVSRHKFHKFLCCPSLVGNN
jgi:hypothetical protein